MRSRIGFLCLAGACLLAGHAHAQNGRDDFYYDALSGNCYRQSADQTFHRLGSLPHIPHGRSLAFHVLNVNTMGKRITVGTREISLFQDQPTGFSPSSLISKVIPPSSMTTLQKLGFNMKAASGKDPVDDLKDQIAEFNRQCITFKEIANLDSSLKSMAAYGEQPVAIPDAKDPRQPGLVASQHMAAKFKAYVEKLFADSGSASIVQKGAASQVTPDDLDTLAESKVSDIKTTFAGIQQNYYSVRQVLTSATPPPVISKSASTEPPPPSPTVQAANTHQQQLDLAFQQAQQNEAAIDLDAASRQARLQSAAMLYKKLTTENIYQYDGPACLTNADEVVFTIQIWDANVSPPPMIASQVLSSGDVNTFVMTAPKGTTAPASGKPGTGKKPAAGAKVLASPFPQGGGQAKTSVTGQSQGQGEPDAQYDVHVYMTGRLKMDYSTGLFITDLVNSNYNTVPLSATSFKVVRGAQDQYGVGIGGLMHFYITSASDIVPALSLGLAQGFDGNSEYLLGASLIAGHEQRFILSGGLAGASVQRLDGVSLGSNIGSTTAPTRNVFRLGWFLGLTYNLK